MSKEHDAASVQEAAEKQAAYQASRRRHEPVHNPETGEIGPDFEANSELVDHEVADFISTSVMVPSVDWIMREVVSKGKGTEVELARLVGIATDTAVKTNSVQGQDIPSIQLIGDFEVEVFSTGRTIRAPAAYLPPKWGKQVKALLDGLADDPGKQASMILTLGVRATGKGIPYTWTVRTHIRQPNSKLDALKAAILPRLVSGPKAVPPTLEHDASEAAD